MDKTKIYLFAQPGAFGSTNDYEGGALCEDGEFLAGHVSSSIGWAKHDLGLNSTWKHDIYAAHCPDGYDLVWVDDPDQDPDFQDAYDRHVEKYAPNPTPADS